MMDPEERLPLAPLDNETIERAYAALSPQDQREIANLAMKFEQRLKAKRSGIYVMFGPKNAFEVLAKLGIWVIRTKADISS